MQNGLWISSFLQFLILLSDSHLLAALAGGIGAVGVTAGGGGLAGGPGRAGGPPAAVGGGGLAGGAAGDEAAAAAPGAGDALLAVASCYRSSAGFPTEKLNTWSGHLQILNMLTLVGDLEKPKENKLMSLMT